MDKIELEFLRESNAIERVYDEDSLRQAVKAWEYLKTRDVLTIHDVLETHRILMLHQNLQVNEIGMFRRVPVYIGGHEALDWRMVAPSMQQWCFEGIRQSPPINPVLLHVEYERIHPFVDGNGRTGRMFMNWQFMKRLNMPIMVIHEGTEQMEYYNWFRK